jgi:RNA polymerase sigma factor (sigma-70 family)
VTFSFWWMANRRVRVEAAEKPAQEIRAARIWLYKWGHTRQGVRLSATEHARGAAGAASLEELYERHSRLVAAICRSLLRNPEEAADAAQQTFLSAHRALLSGTRPEGPAAWLATIARNECRQRIRRAMATPLTTPLDEDLAGSGDTTYAAAAGNSDVARLRDAVAELPERQREALLLREVRGLSYEEVASSMGTSTPAVETLLVRARRSVSERIRLLPDLAAVLAREVFARLGGAADAATASAVAAKGAAMVIAAVTATGAAVEVEREAHGTGNDAAAVVRVDNSGPGSSSSGHGRGGGELEARDDSGGRGRGRGRGRSGSGDGRGSEDRSGSNSGSED